MPLDVKTWSLDQFQLKINNGDILLEPDFQRRVAWDGKKQMALVDSIARKVPIGAITLYESHEEGYRTYEVIDGKQRLTSLKEFWCNALEPLSDVLKVYEDEEEQEGSKLAEGIQDSKWEELKKAQQKNFQDYQVPVYIVQGARASAVRSFSRMNKISCEFIYINFSFTK